MTDHAGREQGGVATAQVYPTAPTYNLNGEPEELFSLDVSKFRSEVSDNFFRTARWCPDASAILTTAEDRFIRLYETQNTGTSAPFKTGTEIRCADAVQSAIWYPSASLNTPETFCFVVSVRGSPVKLIDGNDGRTRASYPIVDHRERMVAPSSMAFNLTATKLYCGFENAIEVFDISDPGYDNAERLKTAFTKRQGGGQKGIVSALAFSPDYSGTYAAGTFTGRVTLYSEDTGSTPVQHVEGVKGGGVTQIAFNPIASSMMFVAFRKGSVIQVYDTRDTSVPVAELPRESSSNQRLGIDVDPWGRYLAAGDEHGMVKIWDLTDLTKTEPIFSKSLSHDAVSSVQLHPYKPLLMTTCGSRTIFRAPIDVASDSDSGSEDDSDSPSTPRSTVSSEHEAAADRHSDAAATSSRESGVNRSMRILSFASETEELST